ncbi:hypothetical protein IEQ34_019833 [Dendrobium chrysotoxum]|uniref:CG-1 domain-containing protein n=1 Tax=Dendrobium chrysotoxum TaxID=161865 RepID=A0AAV7FSJ3_DENCH|nr:hypothetical protein IEQ34_019833 [Dendrobium chrysotoxum]
MAANRRTGVAPVLDIEKILQEAQHRWLRPTEICEILRNYHKFCIAPEPPNKPTSGSLFLFDRKVLRYFRRDGHNWRKKKDGKTVKEAHEKLKAGSIDVLHCYYAHGEDKEGFQRRSYWMLEGEKRGEERDNVQFGMGRGDACEQKGVGGFHAERRDGNDGDLLREREDERVKMPLMHIVLVHYREVKGSKASFIQQKKDAEAVRNSEFDSPVSSNSSANPSHVPSQFSGYGSRNGTQQSEYEDADSSYLKRSSMQQIIARQVPDTTLSLRCSSMDLG